LSERRIKASVLDGKEIEMFNSANRMSKRCVSTFVLSLTVIFLQGCNASMQNAIEGRQWAYINGHEIIVKDCYRTSRQQPETIKDAPDGSVHRFMPCKDADILLDHEALTVNGKFYGKLKPSDKVMIDHHKVLINEQAVTEIASK
jgi:hypothetical protein